MPFVIFALPRSRTTWLSKFLTYGNHICGHEELRHCRSLDDVKAWFSQSCIGSAETAASPFWRLLGKIAPTAKIVVVRRPVNEVVDSLMAVHEFERESLTRLMESLDRKLDQIEARLPVLSVAFDELATEEGCKRVFEHCLPYPFDREHWRAWDRVNVQCDMRALVRYYQAYREPLDKLASTAKHRILADLAKHEPVAPDGVTIQAESFDQWISDAIPLFREHLVQVGEAPDQWAAKNIPLMRRIYELGGMQIMTARCNGRMFGYLMTLIAPSLESENLVSAVNTTFYASPEFKGLGIKLQRAAVNALRERGVGEIHFQAGVRGSGEKIETLYKRMGAEYGGKVFRLSLAA